VPIAGGGEGAYRRSLRCRFEPLDDVPAVVVGALHHQTGRAGRLGLRLALLRLYAAAAPTQRRRDLALGAAHETFERLVHV